MRTYFQPEIPKDRRNYQIVRRRKNGQLVRDQLPFEGLYTAHEMAQIVSPEIPGEWVTLPAKEVGFIFGLRQRFTA